MSSTLVRTRRAKDTIVGRLKAADPFELIRWLARSQPDPRKALAELVQNSIDAGARRIHITRLRERGVTALHIIDDGEGVIPDMDRAEALNHIATHIGHSRKRNLTPQQRRELMMQGKYGIGLLGFWAIGQVLEIRSQLPNHPAQLLRLFEDSPRFEIERLRSRLSFGERYTEVVIRGLHRPAFLSLNARRIVDYLAAELRGQLLARDIQILVHDRIARGRAPKIIEVQPARFSGQRLVLPEEIEVSGFSPMRVELYALPAGDTSEGRMSISCGGTVVYEAVPEFDLADFRRAPWADRRLTGLVEFPDFQVAPGTRRGVVPDEAAWAFAAALRGLEPAILAQMEEVEARVAAALEVDMLRQLERAFRDLARFAPEYDFFAVRAPGTAALGGARSHRSDNAPAAPAGATGELSGGAVIAEEGGGQAEGEMEPPSLLPAGTLATLHIVPAATQVERLGQRRLRAEARDASGTRIRRPLPIRWSTDSALGRLDPAAGDATAFQAGPDLGTATITAAAEEGERTARAESTIKIVDVLATSEEPRAGIPEPMFIDDPRSSWRSRMRDSRWEVNSGHSDYRVACETPRRKLRYIAALLAKEVVLHSFPAPQLGPVLERLVEVLTITERRLERG